MNIAVIGMGLVGGSFARAIKYKTEHTVFGADANMQALCKARLVGAIDDILDDKKLAFCEMVIIALYPQAAIDWLAANAGQIAKTAMVTDTCGVKQAVCSGCHELALQHGFSYIGGHPMAGVEHSGFDHSRCDMFENASMVLTPMQGVSIAEVDRLKRFMLTLGFNKTVITDPAEHDRMIAYTSQLAHVVSSAYVQSPCALGHKGFSAGSYRDMTRVSTLNEYMWTELFLDNYEPLAEQLDALIERLKDFSVAIKAQDGDRLRAMLRAGREQKAKADGKVL
ncbi:MAG TPA: prephenate dehydrogenase/arogenate dehydrogenase family protein [Clostridia bacterium]|nr:prephenate dehydrogenase/arogenate dehydrogenase family protein [Clostridia bacterium]